MSLNVGELVSSFAVSFMAIVGVLTFFYRTVIVPIKKAMTQLKEHDLKVENLNTKIDKLYKFRNLDNMFENDVRQLMLESLIAILEVLEKTNENANAIETKKRLLSFLSKSIHYTTN